MWGPFEEYEQYFAHNGIKWESHKICSLADFNTFWDNMLHVFKNEKFYEKIKYSEIDNLIIIFHGADCPDWILGNGQYIDLTDVNANYVSKLSCRIHNLDLQVCYSDHKWPEYGVDYNFAEVFVRSENIDYVYVSPGEISFDFVNSSNYVNSRDQVELYDRFFYCYSLNGANRENLGDNLPIMYRK